MTDRIFFDSNAGDDRKGYLLDFERSKQDIAKMGNRAREGATVLLYMPEELEVEAEMQFDSELDCWRGVPKGPFRIL